MNDALGVEILQGTGHLKGVVGCGDVVEAAVRLQELVELAMQCVLEDQVDVCVVKEEPIEPADVWVEQVALDLDLAAEVLLQLEVDQLLLGHGLDGAHEARLLVADAVDLAQLAFSQHLADFKVCKLERALWLGGQGLSAFCIHSIDQHSREGPASRRHGGVGVSGVVVA